MIFIICVIITIILGFLFYIFNDKDYDFSSIFCGILATISGLISIIMMIILLITYIDCPSIEAKWQERYTSLNTRIEEHMYYPWDRNELIQEVEKWNEDFVAQEAAQKNLWVKIFNPVSIEGLNKIDLTRID